MKRLLHELRRRRVGWALLLYAACAAIVARFATTVLPARGASDALVQGVLASVVLGLIPALLLAWRYRLGAVGLVRERPLAADVVPRLLPGWRLPLVAAAGLAVAGGVAALLRLPEETAMAGAVMPEIRRSIVVLPFTAPGDANAAPLAAGVADDVAGRLGQLRGWRVLSRDSAMRFGADAAARAATARNLGLGHLLSGELRRRDGRLQLDVVLTEARSGAAVWSRRFDDAATRLVDVDAEISAAVRAALGETTANGRDGAGPGGALARDGRTRSLAALEEYWRGLQQLAVKTRASSDRALAHFDTALRLDPDFAEAHAGVARARLDQMMWYSAIDRRASLARVRESVARALALDDRLVEAHEADGEMRLLGGPPEFGMGFYAQAQRAFARALAINPNRASTYALIGLSSRMYGRFDEGLAAWQRAIALDPLSPGIRTDYGRTLDYANRPAEAEAAFAAARRLDPGYADVYYAAANHYGGLAGRLDEAARHVRRAVALDPSSPKYSAMLIATLGDLGLFELALQETVRARSIGESDTFWLSKVVELQARRGDLAAAEAAVERHDALNQAVGIPNHVPLRLWASGLRAPRLAQIEARARVDFPGLFADPPRMDSPYAGEAFASLVWLADLQRDVATRERLLALARPFLPPPDAPPSMQAGLQPVDVMQLRVLAGERDAALQTLRASIEPPNPLLGAGWWLLVEPTLSPLCRVLCGDARYDAIVARLRAEAALQSAAFLAEPDLPAS